jgi:hypothetical protein
MRLDLGPFRLHAFVNLRDVVSDEEHPWAELAKELDGAGVRSVDEALGMRAMAPILDPIRQLLDVSILSGLAAPDISVDAIARLRERATAHVDAIVAAAAQRAGFDHSVAAIEAELLTDLEAALSLAHLVGAPVTAGVEGIDDASVAPLRDTLARPESWAAVVLWIVVRNLGRLESRDQASAHTREMYRSGHFGLLLVEVVQKLGLSEDAAHVLADTVELMIDATTRGGAEPTTPRELADIFEDSVGRRFLAVNTHREVVWFNRERFSQLVGALCAAAAIRSVTADPANAAEGVVAACEVANSLNRSAERSDFRVAEFLVRSEVEAGPAPDGSGRNE